MPSGQKPAPQPEDETTPNDTAKPHCIVRGCIWITLNLEQTINPIVAEITWLPAQSQDHAEAASRLGSAAAGCAAEAGLRNGSTSA
jgi:hypothetical protein